MIRHRSDLDRCGCSTLESGLRLLTRTRNEELFAEQVSPKHLAHRIPRYLIDELHVTGYLEPCKPRTDVLPHFLGRKRGAWLGDDECRQPLAHLLVVDPHDSYVDDGLVKT